MAAVSQDLDLVTAALDGDRRAFDRLFEFCFGMAARFVKGRAASREQERALIRHAMRAIFARLPDYRGETPLFAFVFVAMSWSLAPQPAPLPRPEEQAEPLALQAGVGS